MKKGLPGSPFILKSKSKSISRVLYQMIIYLWRCITASLKPSVAECRAGLILQSMLLRMGFTRDFSYHHPCELLPHISTIADMAFIFCCTFLGVASTGCYPAPCSMEPGLSSRKFLARDHLTYFFVMITFFNFFVKLISNQNAKVPF